MGCIFRIEKSLPVVLSGNADDGDIVKREGPGERHAIAGEPISYGDVVVLRTNDAHMGTHRYLYAHRRIRHLMVRGLTHEEATQ